MCVGGKSIEVVLKWAGGSYLINGYRGGGARSRELVKQEVDALPHKHQHLPHKHQHLPHKHQRHVISSAQTSLLFLHSILPLQRSQESALLKGFTLKPNKKTPSQRKLKVNGWIGLEISGWGEV